MLIIIFLFLFYFIFLGILEVVLIDSDDDLLELEYGVDVFNLFVDVLVYDRNE